MAIKALSKGWAYRLSQCLFEVKLLLDSCSPLIPTNRWLCFPCWFVLLSPLHVWGILWQMEGDLPRYWNWSRIHTLQNLHGLKYPLQQYADFNPTWLSAEMNQNCSYILLLYCCHSFEAQIILFHWIWHLAQGDLVILPQDELFFARQVTLEDCWNKRAKVSLVRIDSLNILLIGLTNSPCYKTSSSTFNLIIRN